VDVRSPQVYLVFSISVSGSTFASLALALVAVAAAFGAVLATRPAARRLKAASPTRRMPPWLRDRVSASVLVLVAGAAVALALVAVFVEILDAVVDEDDLAVIDRPAAAWLAQRRTGWSSAFVVAVTDIGGKVLLTSLLAVTASVVALRLRSWRPLVLASVAGVGGVLLVATIKALIGRDRPDPLQRAIIENGFSFPSGHSASAVVVLGMVAWLISMVTARRTVRATAWVAAAMLAVAVGLSRVYLGVHYPSDVLAGWTLGATWLSTIVVAARLPDSALLPLVRRWRGAEQVPGPVARRPIAVFTIAAAAGFAAILGAVSLSAIGD
jgi:membrane-associated phospholipid phosphatase